MSFVVGLVVDGAGAVVACLDLPAGVDPGFDHVVVAEHVELVDLDAQAFFESARPGVGALEGRFGDGLGLVADAADFGQDHGAVVGSGIVLVPGFAAFAVDGVLRDFGFAFGEAMEGVEVVLRELCGHGVSSPIWAVVASRGAAYRRLLNSRLGPMSLRVEH